MNFKKFLSLTTAAIMAVSALAVTAFAATPTTEEYTSYTIDIFNKVNGDEADPQKSFAFEVEVNQNLSLVIDERYLADNPDNQVLIPSGAIIDTLNSKIFRFGLKDGEHVAFTIYGDTYKSEAIKSISITNEDYTTTIVKDIGGSTTTIDGNILTTCDAFNGSLTITNTKGVVVDSGVTKVTGDPIYTVNATLISNKADSTAVAPNIGVDVTLSPATAEQVSGEIKQGLQFTGEGGAPINPSVMVAFNNEDGTAQFVGGKLTKTAQFDMKDVTFPSAGIYRYVMSMSDGYVGSAGNVAAGITGYNSKTMYLDIYVENTDDGNTKIAYFVTSIPGEDGSVTKSEGFEINYSSFDLSLTNNTTGSAGDKGKDFTYTVKFDPNTIKGYYLMADEDNSDNYTLVDDTTCTVTLKHGGVINFLNVPKGAKYEITGSSAEGYTTTITAAGDDVSGEIDNTTYKFKELTDGINGDTQVTYTNNKEGVLPTGVILATIVPTVVGIAAIGGIGAFIVVKKKDNDDEEEE